LDLSKSARIFVATEESQFVQQVVKVQKKVLVKSQFDVGLPVEIGYENRNENLVKTLSQLYQLYPKLG